MLALALLLPPVSSLPPAWEQELRPYTPRNPEHTPLHKAVREHKETFLEELCARTGHGLPCYAERELSRYLCCGVLAHGFARVRCGECGHEALVRSRVRAAASAHPARRGEPSTAPTTSQSACCHERYTASGC